MQAFRSMTVERYSHPSPVRRYVMSPTSLQAGTGLVKSRRTRLGLGFAFGSGIVVRFSALGVQPRIPQLAHQLAHPIQGRSGELGGREALHEPRAEPAVRLQPDAPYGLALGRPAVFGAAAGRPRAESGPARAEGSRHHLDREFGPLRRHRPVARGCPCSLAKKAAAFFQEGVLHLGLAYAPPRLAQLAVLGLRIGLARELAAAVLDPFADGFRVEAELGAALRYRPARRDDVVGGLAPELVGVPGGRVGHGAVISVVAGCILKHRSL